MFWAPTQTNIIVLYCSHLSKTWNYHNCI